MLGSGIPEMNHDFHERRGVSEEALNRRAAESRKSKGLVAASPPGGSEQEEQRSRGCLTARRLRTGRAKVSWLSHRPAAQNRKRAKVSAASLSRPAIEGFLWLPGDAI